MIIRHRGKVPKIDPTAYVAPTVTIVGNVQIGAGAKVMFGAVINSEGSKITIGESVIISENAVIRATAEGDQDLPVDIGDHVFIGPHATVLGTTMVRSREYSSHFEGEEIKVDRDTPMNSDDEGAKCS